MEVRKRIETFRVHFKCPECDYGYLVYKNGIFLTYPPKFKHICDNKKCGHTEDFTLTYPYMETKEVELY
jgi:hypothetical protein